MAEKKKGKLDQILDKLIEHDGKFAEHDKKFDVITDELRSKHNLVMGRLTDLDKGQKELKEDVGTLKKDMKDVKSQISVLDTSVSAAHYDIKEMDRSIKGIDRKLEAHIKVPHAA